MDTNQAEEKIFQPQTHNIKLVTKKGFHVDGSLDGSLKSFMLNYSLINVLRKMHEGVIQNNHACGSAQIDCPLATFGLV
jgi:hypothetical protein